MEGGRLLSAETEGQRRVWRVRVCGIKIRAQRLPDTQRWLKTECAGGRGRTSSPQR